MGNQKEVNHFFTNQPYHTMIRNIMSALAFATLLSCNAQTPRDMPLVGATLVGATLDIPDCPPPPPPPALNVSIGWLAVQAYYPYAEFILSYCGEATVEVDGETRTFEAEVFQFEPGVWLACAANGDYIKVYAQSGTTEVEFSGEVRTFTKQ